VTLTCRQAVAKLAYKLTLMIGSSCGTLTCFLRPAVLQYEFVGRVETDAAHHVAELGAVDHAVATVPEVEQVEYVLDICARNRRTIAVDRDVRTSINAN
jgi:hypothetical protein